MALKTRKPTGQVSWPFLLLAGAEKSGKSYAAAAFSASDLIGRTFWIEVGESDADMYGSLPGARYEIVEHDGTMASILQAVHDASAEPTRGGKPNCIVVDSITNVWDMLIGEQEAVTIRRIKELNPHTTVEVLIPDFQGRTELVDEVIAAAEKAGVTMYLTGARHFAH